MRQRWSTVLAVLSALTVAVASVPVARAQPFGSDWDHTCDATLASQCLANNYVHTIYFSDFSSSLKSDAVAMINEQYEPTDLDTTVLASDPGQNVDVRAYDGYYGSNGAWAWTQCDPNATYGGDSSNHTRYCRPQLIFYNYTYGGSWDSYFGRRYVTCHEVGHTVGLRHSSNDGLGLGDNNGASCMYPDVLMADQLDSHDRSHVDSYY